MPLKFTKYFLNVFATLCTSKSIVTAMKQPTALQVLEQLILKLQYEGLNELGANSEGKAMMNSLEVSIVKLVGGCDTNTIFGILTEILAKYKADSKATSTIIKALTQFNNEVEASELDIQKTLLAIHRYLSQVQAISKIDEESKEVAIFKTILNKLIEFRKGLVLEVYMNSIGMHPDLHLKQWINLIFKSVNSHISSIPRKKILNNK
eukprot:TRINITY_DN11781_c0_g1_i1.p2 TRINITY_DN11781_c0_g1~~TRINITY_DN11781_c0_g1_i1.p2  ORF type:complete len:207 (+),score=25.35 TRINITY_DN11781_c0_g1_i1:157-777(+)